MMRPKWIDDLPDDVRDEADFDWNERAAILEYDGGFSRETAEMMADVLMRPRYMGVNA